MTGGICALWFARQDENARATAISVALCLALTVGAKIALMIVWRGGPLRSPSGHAALAALVYGTAALALWRSGERLQRALAAALAALILAVGVSRFVIGGHSRTEVAAGLAIGSISALWLAPRLRPLRIKSLSDTIKGVAAGLASGGFVWLTLTKGAIDEERIAAFAGWLRDLLDGV